ncbi:MAG: glycosyltransferase [Muribaculaceae bacterium]|nr:glycosyltransferase [Muribaculaceae bacterium]
MKVTHIIERLDTGGAQSLLAQLLPAISARGAVDVTVMVYQSCGSAIEESLRQTPGVRFVNLDLKQTRTLSPVFRMVSEVREADVVHAHLFPALYHVALASWIAGTPAVYTEHNVTNRRRRHKALRLPERMIYGMYAGVTSISNAGVESLRSWLGEGGENVSLIPNGIDVSRFAIERPHPSQWPVIFGRSGRAIVMVSRFSAAKDQATLIRAVPHIEDKEAFVVLVGDGETRGEVERLASELGVSDRVVFTGNRSDVPRLLAAAEIGVLSTHWEGMSMSVIEMMASGLPIVATDVAGMREMLDGVGRLVPEGDERALAGVLNELLTGGCREDAGRIAVSRQRAGRYDIAAVAEAYVRLYKELV